MPFGSVGPKLRRPSLERLQPGCQYTRKERTKRSEPSPKCISPLMVAGCCREEVQLRCIAAYAQEASPYESMLTLWISLIARRCCRRELRTVRCPQQPLGDEQDARVRDARPFAASVNQLQCVSERNCMVVLGCRCRSDLACVEVVDDAPTPHAAGSRALGFLGKGSDQLQPASFVMPMLCLDRALAPLL